jgi:hypothetical protein
VHLVGRHGLLCLACTRRKVYLPAGEYVRELQTTEDRRAKPKIGEQKAMKIFSALAFAALKTSFFGSGMGVNPRPLPNNGGYGARSGPVCPGPGYIDDCSRQPKATKRARSHNARR